MKKLIKKRLTILILLTITSTIFMSLIGCGGFNEDNAKKESRIVLDEFFKVSDTSTVIGKWNEMDKIRVFVDKNCKKYFTDEFINDTTNELSRTGVGNTPQLFYLNNKFDYKDKVEKIKFYNNYKIYSLTVDKENETVTYKLESNETGIAPTTEISVQMKKQNGVWKINKVIE